MRRTLVLIMILVILIGFLWYRANMCRKEVLILQQLSLIRRDLAALDNQIKQYVLDPKNRPEFHGNKYYKCNAESGPSQIILLANAIDGGEYYSIYFLNPEMENEFFPEIFSTTEQLKMVWLIHHEGFDGIDDLNLQEGNCLVYDPTNGLTSKGDIIRTGALAKER